MKKQELAEKIKKFMYDYKFRNDSENECINKIISALYLKSILSKAYSDNSKIPPYVIICGDFNKLHNLNLKYGFHEGDRCIKQAIRLISQVLPKDALICRYGGDEFIFIIPNVTDNSIINKYIQDIHYALLKNKEELHELTISLAYGTSYEAKSLNDVFAIVDKRVCKEKLLSSEYNNFYQTFNTLYNALRLSPEFSFSINEIRKLISLEISATLELLKEYKENGCFKEKEPNIYKELALLYKDEGKVNSPISTEEAIILNRLFIENDSISEEMLENISRTSLACIAKDLVYSYSTNAFSRDYFLHYLQENLPNNKKYRAVLLTLSGLKLSNLLIGHNATDKYLYEVSYRNILENIDTRLPLCKELFNPNGFCYKIDIGGGDLLYIEPAESRYRPKDEFYRNNSIEPLLKYVKISTTHPISIDEIMDFVCYAGVQSKVKKDEIKKELFESEYAIELAKVCVRSSLEKYCKSHPNDYLDIGNIKKFIEEDCAEMLKIREIREDEYRKTSFKPSDIHFDYCYNDENEK